MTRTVTVEQYEKAQQACLRLAMCLFTNNRELTASCLQYALDNGILEVVEQEEDGKVRSTIRAKETKESMEK